MSYSEPLSQKAIAISISDSAELAALGMADEHLRDAMAEVARHLLAMGARLIYGGDLRANGFTEVLFELVARYRRDADIGDTRLGVVNYFAWPIVTAKPAEEWRKLADELAGVAEVKCLDAKGGEVGLDSLPAQPQPPASDQEWADSLSAMRATVTSSSHARVVLGGKTSGYKGAMPGIAEETLAAMRANQPVYVLGGFGGCAGDIAADLGLTPLRPGPKAAWPSRAEFASFKFTNLNNGLDEGENRVLARTIHVDEAITLILRGLFRRFSTSQP